MSMITTAKDSNSYSKFFCVLAAVIYLLAVLYSYFMPVIDLRAAAGVGIGEDFFSYDLLNFITAFRVFCSGDNPYSAQLQNDLLQLSLQRQYPHHLNFLYPPMTLALFAPLLWLPFDVAQMVWLLFSVIAIGAAADCLVPKNAAKKHRMLVVVIAVTFAPFLSAAYWGQFTAFVVLALAVAIRAVEKKHYILSGLLFACCIIKPQIWFLAAIGLAVWCVRYRCFVLVVSFFCGVLGISLLLEVISPGIHSNWLSSVSFVSAHAAGSLTPTISGLFRLFLMSFAWEFSSWIPRVLTLLSVLAFGLLAAGKRDWPFYYLFSVGLIFSGLFAPYSWFHDQTVLLLPLTIALTPTEQGNSSWRLWLLGGISLFTTAIGVIINTAQHELIWFALVCICLFLSRTQSHVLLNDDDLESKAVA